MKIDDPFVNFDKVAKSFIEGEKIEEVVKRTVDNIVKSPRSQDMLKLIKKETK
ncbi:MAG: hypothetical protein ACRC5M_04415 [Anaeroplasmataceae bacterium]